MLSEDDYEALANADYRTSDMEVRRKAINIVLTMTSGRNVEDVVMFLKKQLQRTIEQEQEKVITL
jgi:vesicle coat complex subunit